ncbi:telomerase Cajal body protein 1 homolog [Episyrphus balteatus]|uniref:telomerase Cajal body protein 1 homolog n=1 Tax=Episyrphus balteatus TaxID=286459 RepID=UPI002485C5C2|nr:telomerase Cajal body protein 1 homolog [Episyrphus balteatus]
MDTSSNSSYIEQTKVDQTNSTVVEVPDLSMEPDNFHSVEESQIAITFDVSAVSEETSLDDKTQYTSQIDSIIEEDVSVSMDTSTALLEDPSQNGTNPTAIEESDENFFFKKNLLELGRYMWETNHEKQCYTKGCLWSPDGTCCLVPVHLDGMHLIELPSDLYQGKVSPNRGITKLSSAVHVKEGGTVYDCSWYPFMNSQYPETCCWLASRQHEPIQMWDAFNGDLRASYRGYDDVDEIEAAISVIFSPDGEHVLGGYKKCIRIFDTDIPGRSCTKLVTKQAISAFALTSQTKDIITTGSWNGVISLFDKRMPNMGSLHSLFGHNGGITFLKYSNDGNVLFSGARKDNGLCLWDMRDFSKPMAVLSRSVSSNQRIYFDLSPQNEWLLSGDSEGLIRMWNLNNIEEKRSFRVHGDSCNGVSFHPNRPIIASSAGQFHFLDQIDDKCTEERVVEYENSLIFWWIEPRNS